MPLYAIIYVSKEIVCINFKNDWYKWFLFFVNKKEERKHERTY